MAFPELGIITSFTGSDESPISEGAIWDGPLFAGHSELQRLSNQAKGAGADNSSYLVATYGPNIEFYFTIADMVNLAQEISLFFKMSNPGGTMDGYMLDLDDDIVRVFRVDDNANTQLGANINQAFVDGDAIGVSYIDGVITAYRKPSGGSWGSLGTRNDATYQSQTGVFGVYLQSTNNIIDDLGGGTLVTAVTNLMPQIWM